MHGNFPITNTALIIDLCHTALIIDLQIVFVSSYPLIDPVHGPNMHSGSPFLATTLIDFASLLPFLVVDISLPATHNIPSVALRTQLQLCCQNGLSSTVCCF